MESKWCAVICGLGWVLGCSSGGSGNDDRDAAVLPETQKAALDTDGDGFADAIDPAPNDASNPGDFSSPEAIMANAHVKTALAAASKAGFEVAVHTESEPPELAGYYLRRDREGAVAGRSARNRLSQA